MTAPIPNGTITNPPADIPQRADRATFPVRADAFVAWQALHGAEMAVEIPNVYRSALIAYNSALTAINAPGTSATSTSSVTLGTGTKVFTVEVGKELVSGMHVIASSDIAPSDFIYGVITAYTGSTLTINCLSFEGTGSRSAWTISITYPVSAAGAAAVPEDNHRRLLNSDFNVWQEAASQTASGYGSDDQWLNLFAGGSMTHSRQSHVVGQTDVPDSPEFFSRTVVTHAAGAVNFHVKQQKIEDVRSYAGESVTLSFYMRADAGTPDIAVELFQDFGSGGSADVYINPQKITLSTTFTGYELTFAVPSIAGKTLGAGHNLSVNVWFEAGSSFDARTGTLGQQSGTFDLSHIQDNKGGEAKDWVYRSVGEELALCQRYWEVVHLYLRNDIGSGSAWFGGKSATYQVQKRAVPTVTLITNASVNVSSITLQAASERQVTYAGLFAAAAMTKYMSLTMSIDARL